MVIEATDINIGTVRMTETCYFTGGLTAQPLDDGTLFLAPVGINEQGFVAHVDTWPEILSLTQLCGCTLVGVNQSFQGGGPAPQETWRPDVRPSEQQLHAADSWGAISHQAIAHKDIAYAAVARYVSVSVHAAGVRLRDVARAHHDQLRWAFQSGKRPGLRFSNTAMTDLYLAFHSLASELCSARDHLARIAAMHCGAKESVDSMARFDDWALKSMNIGTAAAQPLSALLMSAWGTAGAPGWLRTMGEVRNEMIHRQPMAANPDTSFLALSEIATPAGPILTIRLASAASSDNSPDPFATLFGLYSQFELLAIKASALARYDVKLPQVVGR